MKKYIFWISALIAVIVILFFWYEKYRIQYFEQKNKECYENTQKIKPTKDDNWAIYGQIYSQKIWTCLYYWAFWSLREWKTNSIDLWIKELYSNKNIEVENICNYEITCQNLMNDQWSILKDKKQKFGKIFDSYK